MLMMVPLGFAFVGVGFGIRNGSAVLVLATLGLVVPMVVGALLRGGNGLIVGGLLGFSAVCLWKACLLLVFVFCLWRGVRFVARSHQ